MGRVIIKVTPSMMPRATKALQANHSVHHLATKVEAAAGQPIFECLLLESSDFPVSPDPPVWLLLFTMHSDPKTHAIRLTANWVNENGRAALTPQWEVGRWVSYSEFVANWK